MVHAEKDGTGKGKEGMGMGGVRGGDVVRWVAGIIGVAVSLQSMVVSSPSSSSSPSTSILTTPNVLNSTATPTARSGPSASSSSASCGP